MLLPIRGRIHDIWSGSTCVGWLIDWLIDWLNNPQSWWSNKSKSPSAQMHCTSYEDKDKMQILFEFQLLHQSTLGQTLLLNFATTLLQGPICGQTRPTHPAKFRHMNLADVAMVQCATLYILYVWIAICNTFATAIWHSCLLAHRHTFRATTHNFPNPLRPSICSAILL